MKLDLKRHKIEKAASEDEMRPAIAVVYLDVENERLVATNSYVLATVPVEIEEGDVSGNISLDTIAEARRRQPRKQEAAVTANGEAAVSFKGGTATFERPDTTFPTWETLMEKQGAPIVRFGISASQLSALAAALGTDGVEIEVYSPMKGIHVRALEVTDAVGLIMPILLA